MLIDRTHGNTKVGGAHSDRPNGWPAFRVALPLVGAAMIAVVASQSAFAQDAAVADRVCEIAATTAELQYDLPPGLLRAIGRIESGRRGPGTGKIVAWPWTINAEGRGQWFDNRAGALTAVKDLQATGVSSIDVGCFQINLRHHPSAFPALEDGFEPSKNADYAARFLLSLKARTGTWDGAVAAYHSANPDRGTPYRERVMAGLMRDGGTIPAGSEAPSNADPRMPSLPATPVIMRMEAWTAPVTTVGGMRIWTPSAAGRGASVISMSPLPSRPRS